MPLADLQDTKLRVSTGLLKATVKNTGSSWNFHKKIFRPLISELKTVRFQT